MSTKKSPTLCDPAAAPCQPSSSSLEPGSDTVPVPVTRQALLGRRLVRLRACRSHLSPVRRRKRDMIPADKKDATYWDKRRKNNEAAKRSREKRRINDMLMEGQLLTLSEENAQLRAQVLNLQYQSSLGLEQGRASACTAASPASSLSLPPHAPAFLQAGLWRTRQETGAHPFEGKIPCFSPVFNPLSRHLFVAQGPAPLSGPRVLPHAGAAGACRPAEGDVDPQRRVFSSCEDLSIFMEASSQPLSALATLLPPLEPLHHASTVPYLHQSWVEPYLNHQVMWRSSYLQRPGVYTGRPIHAQGKQGVEDHI